VSAKVIDCTAIANEMKEELKKEIETLKGKGIVVGIATVLVGDDFGAKMYRKQVEKFC
jgi:methylenetetrahydrofolate dehydrogenase (NADP+)/methenyltetrahydrofolate cyclohydrolase